MQNPLFLLGAGFNKDAQVIAGPIMGRSIYIGEYQIECGYPLLNDLWHICFPSDAVIAKGSIETRFQQAIEKGDWEPFKRMYHELMKADYYIVPKLLPGASRHDNCYATFFMDFPSSSYLTFNYDSLPEIFLLRLGRWYPHDGYGVPVEAELEYWADDFQIGKSSSLVLHMHGSLCVYTSEFESTPQAGSDEVEYISLSKAPKFRFDPDRVTHLFAPYKRVPFDPVGYEDMEERVIAPVPNKVQGLRKHFIRTIYSKTQELLTKSRLLVAIGYDFNPHDRTSFGPVLEKFSQQTPTTVLLVSPNASEIKRRLAMEYRNIRWLEFSGTFKEWVESSYSGLTQ